MKREIKFRAWLPEHEGMIYIGDCHNDTALWIGEGWFDVIDHFTGKPVSLGNSDEGVIIMQYTGIKDKKGKEIYEGDIVKVKNGENPAITECKWDWGMFTLVDNAGGHWNRQLFHEPDRLKVIGNIYENSDLL